MKPREFRDKPVETNAPSADQVKFTTCYMCACRCGIKVHLKDGGIRYIEGNRNHPVNKGVLCAKGSAGIMQHYSPARLQKPLLRVGPRGSGEFKEIEWEEALATATIIDFYRRHFVKEASDSHYLTVSKLATIFWGLFACVVAMYAANQGSLIEVVNRYGSFFYGSLLGVFILAILTSRATATGAFFGLIAGMVVVLTVAFVFPWIEFLWHNVIGAVVVVVVGLTISFSGSQPHFGIHLSSESSR